ncbi:MAG: acyl-CoA mutase large subunit family protein [Candidatus Hodarchaeales archaeon]|jgi:methylmalonyl-CoA mutase N-terminal domain/subunit
MDISDTKNEKVKKKKNDDKKVFNFSGIPIDICYTPDEAFSYSDLNFPGEFPFTRGVYPTMYRGRLFTMRQYAGFATAKETNERYKFLLNQGQTGLSVAFDLPTQIGYDSDDLLARGEVGKTGVAICSLEDMEILFKDIPLEKVSTSMTINAPAAILLCMYIVVAEKQGVEMEKLRGTIQNDILKEYIARGTYIFPLRESMRLIVDTFEFCEKYLPKWNTISISGYHIREAGSTAVQEVAFTLANGIAYVEAAIEANLDPNKFGERLSFFFGSHNDFFEEVAKFRAARRLWAKIMKNRFNVNNPRAQMLRFHTQTAGVTLTAQQPENNAIRVAYQALAAILGGTQSLHTNSMDEALALPTPESAQLALRTQQIAAFETNITNTVDPLGGSYYIENLTNKIEEKAMEYIKIIDDYGGMISAIEKGYIQKEIHEAAYRYQREVERKFRPIIGVNTFVSLEKTKIPILIIDKQKEKEQIGKVKKLKETRDKKKVETTLKNLENAAKEGDNLLSFILDAVRAYGTIGEISNILRGIWGEYKSGDIF